MPPSPISGVWQSVNLPFPHIASGKVREIFDLGDALLLVATDRLSAFDVILPDGIPGKGAILTQISNWWFAQTSGLIQRSFQIRSPGGISHYLLRTKRQTWPPKKHGNIPL